MHTFKKWMIIFLLLSTAGFGIAWADAGKSDMEALINDLQKKIEEADKRMVAHPAFLDELRALLENYRARIRTIFFSDDFSDGDFTKNPEWKVESGRFQISTEKRLFSQVGASAPVKRTEEKPLSPEQQALGLLLKGIMGGGGETQNQPETAAPADFEEAVIKTTADIDPTFEVDMTFVSNSQWGSMEIVLSGGSSNTPRYRLIYHAAASSERPIELVRDRAGRQYTIESALQYPNLDDNLPHRLQWTRDMNGSMKVLVDGKEILSTVEVYYREKFKGLTLVNRGGTYAWGPIRVMSAPAVEQNKK